MKSAKNRTSMFIVLTGGIIAAGRILLGMEAITVDEPYLLIIMAIVNYVALGFVFLFLYNGLADRCGLKISNSGLDTKLKNNCRKIMNFFSMVLLLLYGLLGLLYVTIWKNSDMNDAISIFALAVSIATNGLVEENSIKYYEMVKWCAKHMEKSSSRVKQNSIIS